MAYQEFKLHMTLHPSPSIFRILFKEMIINRFDFILKNTQVKTLKVKII
jgi:hypothetical protein